jgi:hypothetical protein
MMQLVITSPDGYTEVEVPANTKSVVVQVHPGGGWNADEFTVVADSKYLSDPFDEAGV